MLVFYANLYKCRSLLMSQLMLMLLMLLMRVSSMCYLRRTLVLLERSRQQLYPVQRVHCQQV